MTACDSLDQNHWPALINLLPVHPQNTGLEPVWKFVVYLKAVIMNMQAFDKVWSEGLLYKIKNLLPAPYYGLIRSYLDKREFKVIAVISNCSCHIQASNGIREYLVTLAAWCKRWNLKINPMKTTNLCFILKAYSRGCYHQAAYGTKYVLLFYFVFISRQATYFWATYSDHV